MKISLPEGTYMLSFVRDETEPKIIRRKWWDIFGIDRLEFVTENEQVSLFGISREMAELIANALKEGPTCSDRM